MANKHINSYVQYDPSNAKKYRFNYNNNETSELHRITNKNPSIDMHDLRRISLWKLNRVLDVSDDTIKDLQNLASLKTVEVDSDIAKNILNKLVSSRGIGFPMASAILKFTRPDIFPIIDVRAYRALTGKKIYYSQYTIDLYIKYVEQLKIYANKLNIPLSEMDEQLYEFDKEHNRKI